MNIFAIIKMVRKIERPPEVEKEKVFREWCGRTLVVLDQIATHTGDPDAREMVDTLAAIHDQDVLWDPAYDVLRMASHYVTETDKRAAVKHSTNGADALMDLVIAAGG